MNHDNATFEIHVHGDIPIKPGTDAALALAMMHELITHDWLDHDYIAQHTLGFEEPGLQFDKNNDCLRMCWTVRGDEDFRQVLDELCMNLNELSSAGAPIEISYYDTEFDEEDESRDDQSRDDFLMLFVGPDPGAIMQAQRDLLVHDVVHTMERHFDASELSGVVAEIDKLFSQRFDNLVSSLDLGKPPRGNGGNGGSGHGGGGRRPRHLH